MNVIENDPEKPTKAHYEPAELTVTPIGKPDLLLSAEYELKESEWESFSFEFIF